MCAPVARKARAADQDRNLRSARTSHAGAEAAQQVRGQRLLGVGIAADRRAQQAAGPGLGRRDPPGLRERPVPGLVRRPAEERGVLAAVRHVGHRPVHRDHAQPAAEHPQRPVRPRRPGHVLEQHPHRISAQLPPAPRQRGDVRQPPLPPAPGVHPQPRRQPPGQQVRAPPLAVQPVGQLGHHLAVPAVPAPEQPQRQDEIHHQPGREQPAPLLARPGDLDDLVDQLRRERPGQYPDRDPVRQPAVRRQTLRTIMSHKTVTLSRQTLKQGPWASWGSPARRPGRRSRVPRSPPQLVSPGRRTC